MKFTNWFMLLMVYLKFTGQIDWSWPLVMVGPTIMMLGDVLAAMVEFAAALFAEKDGRKS